VSIFTGTFWKAALERAVKTFAQAEAALLVADGTGILNTDWQSSLSASGMAAVISILTSVASDAATGDGPSLTNAEVLPEETPKDERGMTTTELCLLVVAVGIVILTLFGSLNLDR
jgi:hypothetical protein